MKFQGRTFVWLAVFFLGVAIWYGVWSKDPTGTTALFLAFGLCTMIGFYLSFIARRMDTGPGDNPEAEVSDDAGDQGFFSPWSWQPLFLTFGCALTFLGVIFGWWLCLFSAPIVAVSVWSWAFEYYRGADQRY